MFKFQKKRTDKILGILASENSEIKKIELLYGVILNSYKQRTEICHKVYINKLHLYTKFQLPS